LPPCAGLVLDDDRLLQRRLHLVGGEAGDDVARAARRERQDDPNRALWPGASALRDRELDRGGQPDYAEHEGADSSAT
jgi:hypothetical protein